MGEGCVRSKGLAQRKRGTGQPATGFRFGTRDPRPGIGLDGDEKKNPSLPGKRINRSASLQGAPKGVHSWRGWWGEGHRAPHATCESIRRPVCKLKKSRRLWGCRHHYSQESSNTEKCNWEFSFELKTLTCIINIHMLTIL